MILQAAVLSVLLCSVYSFTVQASSEKSKEYSGNTIEDDDFSVSTLLEKANRNVGKNFDEPRVMFGDIAMPTGLQNADPCTQRGCLWPKATDGNVYVPYRISNQYSRRERDAIIRGLRSFAASTCIRFTPLNRQRDFVDIQSRSGVKNEDFRVRDQTGSVCSPPQCRLKINIAAYGGLVGVLVALGLPHPKLCYSYVGRRGNAQIVSLSRQGCVFEQIIQHELLHALGFDHEQTRSDRDQHVRILLQNVIPGMEFNFRKIQTRNLGTPYDYNSVMHYGRYAFSRNRQPTIIPTPNSNVAIGRATRMSSTDILRMNRLYRCNSTLSRPHLEPVHGDHFL